MQSSFGFSGFTRIVIFLVLLVFLLSTCSYFDCGITPIQDSFQVFLPRILVIFFLFVFVALINSSIKSVALKKEEIESESKTVNILNFFRYGLWAVFVLISASIVFQNFGALLTSLGLIGFGITFSLQKPILNFVGWLSIKFNRPFRVGDRIRIGNFSGDITEIKMMHVVMKSLLEEMDQYSGKIITIPNELVLIEPVENYTREDNFLKAKLNISITYESDWRKAKNIFEEIVKDVTKSNLHKYRKRLAKKLSFIDDTIEKLSGRFEKTTSREREKKIKEHISELEKQKENLQETVEEFPSGFKPKVYVDLSDSSIMLLALFSVPYNAQRTVKTEINMRFLEAIKKEKNIEIAYPHLQLITGKKSHLNNSSLTDFLDKNDFIHTTEENNLTEKKN